MASIEPDIRQPPEFSAASSRIAPTQTCCVDSSRLLAGRRELLITHHGDTYCLRVTRNGKLILTK